MSPGIAGLVAIGTVLAGCVSMTPTPPPGTEITDLDLEPRIAEVPFGGPAPNGPVVEVARGTVGGSGYRMTVYRQDGGLCIGTAWSSGEGQGCGALPGDAVTGHEVFGMTGWGGGGDSAMDVSGVVRSDADAVIITTDRGDAVQAVMVSLAPAEIDAAAFFAFLPAGLEIESLVAVGGDGEVLESFTPIRP